MARGKPGEHGAVEILEQFRQQVRKRPVGLRLAAAAHFAEHQRARPTENPRQAQLHQHAIDPVGTLVDILQEQH